jgi:hypothetical protein
MLNKTMTKPVVAKSIDLRTFDETVFFTTIHPAVLEDGQITNLCAYFKVYLDESNTLTNSPWAPPTHWTNLVYTLARPKPVKKDEQLDIEVLYDGGLRATLL